VARAAAKSAGASIEVANEVAAKAMGEAAASKAIARGASPSEAASLAAQAVKTLAPKNIKAQAEAAGKAAAAAATKPGSAHVPPAEVAALVEAAARQVVSEEAANLPAGTDIEEVTKRPLLTLKETSLNPKRDLS